MEGIVTSLTTAITTMIASCMDFVGDLLPIALPLVGAGIVIAFALKYTKKITGKA